ncbi:MAG: gamma carbonic anhydrase family protein [Carbonactinosporaceae bacterium]
MDMTHGLVAEVGGHKPQLAPDAWVAPQAAVLGQVRLGPRVNIWYGSVLRGDGDGIDLGADCNVQDASVIHADPGYPAILGDRVSLGHRATVHGARIDDDVLIGMGAIVMNGARIGSWSIVAAGALVPEGMEVPPGSLVIGVPGTIKRAVTDDERAMITRIPRSYLRHTATHRDLRPLEGTEL